MATVAGKVIDLVSKEPLAGASIRLADAKGNYQGQGVAADNKDEFNFVSAQLPGSWLAITAVSHVPMLIYANILIGKAGNVIQLARTDITLPPVVVTPKPKQSNTIWWILGIATGYFLIRQIK